jgi:murein DD-endopeptidase MepM/ murein hydrolase activator NlpD
MRALLLSALVLAVAGVLLLPAEAFAVSVEEAEDRVAATQAARDSAASAVGRRTGVVEQLAARRARLIEVIEAEQEARDALLEHGLQTGVRSPRVMDRVVDRATERLDVLEGALTEVETSAGAAAERVADAEQVLADAERALASARKELDGALLRATWEAGRVGAKELIWPTEGPTSSVFGMRRHPITDRERLHAGIDIPSPTGTPILAAKAGRVVGTSALRGYGLTVIVDHGNGMTTLYAHVSSFEVVEGQDVDQGEMIARVGETGMATGPHLHFEVRIDNTPVDPMTYY